MLGTTDRIIVRKVYRTTLEITENDNLSKTLAGDAALTPEEREEIPNLAEIVANQYGLLGQHAPAVLLLVMLGGYAARTLMVFNKLDELDQANQARKKKDEPKPAAPVPAAAQN